MNTICQWTSTGSDLACEIVYRFLAACLSDPRHESSQMVGDPGNQELFVEACDWIRHKVAGKDLTYGFGELQPNELDGRRLRARLQRPLEERLAEHDRVFGLLVPRECPPYETEYEKSSEPFYRAQQLADIAGFYRAFGLDPRSSRPERPDHISLELEFVAFLLMKKRLLTGAEGEVSEQSQICEEARQSFFRDHLVAWAVSFATGLRRKSDGGFYAEVSRLLAALVPIERMTLYVAAPRLPLEPSLIERPEEQDGCVACTVPTMRM
jgi:TorA maturation chaperone TorD